MGVRASGLEFWLWSIGLELSLGYLFFAVISYCYSAVELLSCISDIDSYCIIVVSNVVYQ